MLCGGVVWRCCQALHWCLLSAFLSHTKIGSIIASSVYRRVVTQHRHGVYDQVCGIWCAREGGRVGQKHHVLLGLRRIELRVRVYECMDIDWQAFGVQKGRQPPWRSTDWAGYHS